MYYTNELKHHGIKGQKWGVRRYQNADGSYTPLGLSRRYRYGKYRIERNRNKDIDSVFIKRKGGGHLEVTSKSFHDMEKEEDKAAVKEVSEVSGMSVKEVYKFLSNMDKDTADYLNSLIDSVIEERIDMLFEAVDKKDPNALRVRESKQPKPKYTPEQAINKAYEDLEKKYPNFNSFSQDKQDQLWMDYMNESGLYKYTI